MLGCGVWGNLTKTTKSYSPLGGWGAGAWLRGGVCWGKDVLVRWARGGGHVTTNSNLKQKTKGPPESASHTPVVGSSVQTNGQTGARSTNEIRRQFIVRPNHSTRRRSTHAQTLVRNPRKRDRTNNLKRTSSQDPHSRKTSRHALHNSNSNHTPCPATQSNNEESTANPTTMTHKPQYADAAHTGARDKLTG